jgi:poly(A) polymerase Pap1
VEFDLAFVSVNLPTIPPDFDPAADRVLQILVRDPMYSGFDGVSPGVLSLNGVRDAAFFNANTAGTAFLDLLKFVRKWAAHRFIYGQQFGFLGGIACEILCAWIAIRYPQEGAAQLVRRFFEHWGSVQRWHVQIREPRTLREIRWDNDEMIVLTPTFPVQNATRAVAKGTLAVIKKELLRAAAMVREGRPWAEFIQPPELLSDCVKVVDVVFKTERDEEYREWQDFVKSRVNIMVEAMAPIGVVPLPFIFRPRRPNTGRIFLGLTGSVPERMNLTRFRDRAGNPLFVRSEPNGNRVASSLLSIDKFGAVMADDFYASQLPWALPNQSSHGDV